MSHDKATVTVKTQHEKAAQQLRDLAHELDTRYDDPSFAVTIMNEKPLTQGSGASGGTVFTVEVHEYAGEIPVFTLSVEEKIQDAEVTNVDVETGASKFA
jgi:hypothetical protein